MLFTVRGFLGFDYPEMLREAHGPIVNGRPVEELESLERIVLLRGEPIRGTEPFAAFMHDAEHATAEEEDLRISSVGPGRPLRHHLHVGNHRKAQGGHDYPRTVDASVPDVVAFRRAARGRPLPDRQPVLPHVRVQGRDPRVLDARRDDHPARRLRRRRACSRGSRRSASTVLPGPPTLYQSILDHPDRASFDLSSLRLAVTGAAVVPVAADRGDARRARLRDGPDRRTASPSRPAPRRCAARPTTPRRSRTPRAARYPTSRFGSSTTRATRLPRGEPGEVVVRGYNVMQGYFEDPEQTAETIDADGWLHTGDVGVMDERGYIRITDRKKDMFIVGGFNAYPAEIEGELLAPSGRRAGRGRRRAGRAAGRGRRRVRRSPRRRRRSTPMR